MTTTVTPPTTEPARRGRRSKVEHTAGQGQATWSAKLAITVICLLWFIPAFGIFITSLRTKDDADSSGWWHVFVSPHLTFDNYSQALGSQNNLGQSFVNSLAITLPATFIPILIAAFAAYAFTFMKFPFRDTLFIFVVGLLVVPNFIALVPMLKLYGDIGLNGKFPAVWLAHIGFGMPLAVYMLRNYMATLPNEVIESAKIDGASHFQTFWRLVIPMSVPALASFAIFQFLWVWNDLLVALVFLGTGTNEPLTVSVNRLLGSQGQGWQLITAGGFISMVIPIIVFLALQRFFVRGLTAGAVKG